jgi:phosphorylcholine metabolism protein LicD
MINLILIIIVIIIIYIIYIISYNYILQNFINEVAQFNNDMEYQRNEIMNGINMKTYINFAYHYKLFKLLEIVINKLDEKNIKYFLIGGGLIGYHRHNNSFIPWDDDIDLGIMEEDKILFHSAINELVKNNEVDFFIKDNDIINGFEQFGIEKILLKDIKQNFIFIDIFYYKFFDKENYYHFNIESARKLWKNEYFNKDELFPLEKVSFKLYDIFGKEFNKININIPYKSIDYLNRTYKDWQQKKLVTYVHSKYFDLMFK